MAKRNGAESIYGKVTNVGINFIYKTAIEGN